MLELEPLGVQSLPRQFRYGLPRGRAEGSDAGFKSGSVRGISHHGMADMRQMHTNLMSTSSFENEAEQRNVSRWRFARKDIDDFKMGSRLAPLLSASDGDLQAVGTATAQSCIDETCWARKPAPDERQVASMQPPIQPVALELLGQPVVRRVRFGNDEHA
jgi:hypothetical protein